MQHSTKAIIAGALTLFILWFVFYVNTLTPIGWWGDIPLLITSIVLMFALFVYMCHQFDAQSTLNERNKKYGV